MWLRCTRFKVGCPNIFSRINYTNKNLLVYIYINSSEGVHLA